MTRSAHFMNEQEIIDDRREQEKEIANILINSSLYLDMSPVEREMLLRYLVESYFEIVSVQNSRALPSAMRTGPTM
jgi:hypothetical protein